MAEQEFACRDVPGVAGEVRLDVRLLRGTTHTIGPGAVLSLFRGCPWGGALQLSPDRAWSRLLVAA
ncbi:MAG: hypothetical protein H0W37_11680 [Pseudonocardiales bacterium]|nr:hypothetical protein [Pseudonocardiales bacterium]